MALSDSHRLFLQSVMARGAVPEREIRELYLKAAQNCEERGDIALFPGFLSTLNRHLDPLGMQLVHSTMEDSPACWYALVNRSQDPAAKIASNYTPAELELFNKVMEQLVVEGEGLASSTALLNASAQMERKITRRDAQTFLKALVKDKWLSEVSQGVYGAGPRFILELRPFLSDVFGEEVVHCHICKEAVVRGQWCGSGHCQVKLHLYCIAKLARARGVCKCPGCHGNWPHDIPEMDWSLADEEYVPPPPSLNPPSHGGATQQKRPRNRAKKH